MKQREILAGSPSLETSDAASIRFFRAAIQTFTQPVQWPKKNPEENCAADIDAQGVTEFVADSGIVLGVNRDVMSDEKIGQRRRHERALNQAPAKSRRALAASHHRHRLLHQPANECCRSEEHTSELQSPCNLV